MFLLLDLNTCGGLTEEPTEAGLLVPTLKKKNKNKPSGLERVLNAWQLLLASVLTELRSSKCYILAT